jgi:hypothetical protein
VSQRCCCCCWCLFSVVVCFCSPDVSFLPKDLYSLDLVVLPKLGLYANFIAQIVSQISSHFVIHYHDQVVRKAEERRHVSQSRGLHESSISAEKTDLHFRENDCASPTQEDPDLVEESLCSHAFARPHRGENDRLLPRCFATPFLCFTGIVLCLCVILGCVLPSFTVDLLGIIGVAVEAGQGFAEASTQFSLFSMIDVLVSQANFTSRVADFIGLGSFAVLLVVTVLLVPLSQTALLLYHWMRPMTHAHRKRVMTINEVLQAWQYAEVFALAIVAGSWYDFLFFCVCC